MVVYRDRGFSGLGPPVNNNLTTLRPLLAPAINTLTPHYPGSPIGTSFAGMTMVGDVKKKTYVHAVQRNAVSDPVVADRKSYEYNYFIFWDGEVWEYAGDYLAAHSYGDNAWSIGVQFVNGQDDLMTDAQVIAFRWLRDVHLRPRGRVTAQPAIVPHRAMPGAATQCPGDRAIMPRLSELALPYAPPIPPITPEDDDMLRILILNDVGGAAILLHGFTGRWLDPARYNAFHYFYPIVDEAAAVSWLANVTILGALPPGVPREAVWGHQPDA